MTQPKKERFSLHLPGLLEVLAGNLYSNAKVGIRELIQNAHDSCIRRMVEENAPLYQPRIQITTDETRGLLTISDNGHGLSATDIEQYLATIGRSYTRQLKEELAILSPDEAIELIGQFGFGFLSAFMLAEKVTLITRSVQPNSQALRWHSSGGEYYEVTPTNRAEAGTTVELQLKASAAFIFNTLILTETIQTYADFLPVPIYLGQDPTPVNLMTPPWESQAPESAAYDYISRAFNDPTPLCIIPLHDQTVELGHDSLIIPLKGFLFVPPTSVASVREYGDLKVFIRRMFICEQERKLLPPWGRFVRGVIDCPYLQPTASRESIHEDETFLAVQQALETQLGQGLQKIAETEPDIWRRIVHGHTDVITGWAVRDDEFFNRVADIITFRTSRGYLNLPDYLKLTDSTFYYLTQHLGALQEQLLAEGHDAPVIDAHWFAVKPFLEKYATWHPGLNLVQMDGEIQHLLRPTPQEPFTRLLNYYRAEDIQAKVVAFKPVDVPALMGYAQDTEFLMETQQAVEDDDLPDVLAEFINDFLESQIETAPEAIRGTLYLNASSSLVRRLAQKPVAEPTLQATLTLIYQIARLFSGRALTATDAMLAFRQSSEAMEVLIAK